MRGRPRGPGVGSAPTRRSIGTPTLRVHGLCRLVLVCLIAGCTPPDRPTRNEISIAPAALDFLRPDTVRTLELHPGVVYRYFWSPRGPWAIHAVQARLVDRCELGFEVLQAAARENGGLGRERVSEMVTRKAGRVLAAVNADFFTPEGAPVGVEVVDGRVTSSAERPTFAWRQGDAPWIGTAEVLSGRLLLGLSAEEPTAGTVAVGGFPDLIDDGGRVGDLEVDARPSFAAARHPRTAVGWDLESQVLWLVAVDGRQPPFSSGMTLPELAELFEALGVEEALNLDGGGSTALVVHGTPVNRPSDPTGERPVVNALALVRTPEACR